MIIMRLPAAYLLAALLLLPSAQALSKPAYYLLIEKQIEQTDATRLYLKTIKYMAKKSGKRLVTRQLKGDIAYHLKSALREIPPSTQKIIVLTTLSYPSEQRNLGNREGYLDHLRAEIPFFTENFLARQLIFVELSKNKYHFISAAPALLKNFTVINEPAKYQLVTHINPRATAYPALKLALSGPSTRQKVGNALLKSSQCYAANNTIKRGQLPPYFKLKQKKKIFLN